MWFWKKKKEVAISNISIETDIHTHLIPGVDDGRFTYENAVEALVRMNARGVQQVYFTPHIIAGVYTPNRQKIQSGRDRILKQAGEKKNLPGISLGAEYMVDETFLFHLEKGDELFTLPENQILIEMSYYNISPQIFDAVTTLTSKRYKPILAHPERYLYLADNFTVFDKLYEMGCVFQLNLLSTIGLYGETSMKIINYLLECNYYRHVGSDIHSPEQFSLIEASSMSEKTFEQGEWLGLWSHK